MPKKNVSKRFRQTAKRAYSARRRQPTSKESTLREHVDGLLAELVSASEGCIRVTRRANGSGDQVRDVTVADKAKFEILFNRTGGQIEPGNIRLKHPSFSRYLENDFVKNVAKIFAKEVAEAGIPLFAGQESDCRSAEQPRRLYTRAAGTAFGRSWAARATVRQLKLLLENFDDSDDLTTAGPEEIYDSILASSEESEPTWFDDDEKPWPWDEDDELREEFCLQNYADHLEIYDFWGLDPDDDELCDVSPEYTVAFLEGALQVARQIREDAEKGSR